MSKDVRLPLLLLVVAAATIRLWLHSAAMPPYAGLDEVYHVARLSFVLREGRDPLMREPSVPPYLDAAIRGKSDALPVFGVIGAAWPEVVKSRQILFPDRILTERDLAPYLTTNYEAQQPSLYYRLAASLPRLFSERTPLQELRLWRAFSILCGVVTIGALASLGMKLFGPAGVLPAVMLLSTPTWLTLVVRASNDALACALIAVACAVTFSLPRGWGGWWGEALLWSLALGTKLYSWPAAAVLPVIWHYQRAPRRRRALVLLIGLIAVAATVTDLMLRTNNPLGLFAFDRMVGFSRGSLSGIDYGGMVRIIVASGAWTSGQHWNALTPLAILFYIGPILILLAIFVIRYRLTSARLLLVSAVAGASFAVAQVVNAAGYIRQALMTGAELPAGGKEGWYWYALAPLFIGVVAQTCRHAPRVMIYALLGWIIGWDILIHEGALFQDFAGLTNAAGSDAFFRWGPRAFPFTYGSLSHVGVGPGAGFLSLIRGVEVMLIAAATVIAVRHRVPDDPVGQIVFSHSSSRS